MIFKFHNLRASCCSSKPLCTMFPTFSFWLYLLFTFNFGPKIADSTLGNHTDHLALIKFKESISKDRLVSWNSSTHFCHWHGIKCSPKHQRVTELNLEGYDLHGSISSHVGNLSFLRILNLANNNFFGKITQEIGRLLHLQKLNLTDNFLEGEIPMNLTRCSGLKGLYLAGNKLIGKIPIEIGSLWKLQRFIVAKNNLTGGVPKFIGNFSSLTALGLAFNNLKGDIPQEICRHRSLMQMSASSNKLSGALPSCLYNMSTLTIISVPANEFNGSLPSNMFRTLPNLQKFYIGDNQISGPIPTSIANASTLKVLEISRNQFIGHVPSLGKLQDLWRLNLELNNLGGNSTKDLDFLTSLTNCSKLEKISIASNNFGGSLSNSCGNLSTQLRMLYLGGNQITGKIPIELGNLYSLIVLGMERNHFTGIIPKTFGNFQKMQVLSLVHNKLSGDIPAFIGNLSKLTRLGLKDNMLEGKIPPSIGNCHMLQDLDLSQNKLTGTIPFEVFNLPSLLLNLSQNSLSGNLPDEVGRLKSIHWLDVSENHLSGSLPGTIGGCISLGYLYLQGNSFHGIVPFSLTSLKGLQRLGLSRNNLSGSIPNGLQNIKYLEYLNVSFNKLDGEVPTEGVFQNASALAVFGNKNLCGGISELHLPPCPVKGVKPAKHHDFKLIAVIVSVGAFLLILSFILTIYWMRKRNKKPSFDSPTIDQLAKVSYRDLHHGTDGFSARNLIGSGGFGSVYRGNIVSEDRVVAIKVLNLQKKGANKSFIAECNALKNIRHRNLVKILTCCSSTDYKGQEFKALVFEYMKNGSLEQWLHPTTEIEDQQRSLNLEQRLNIIIDVASAFH